MNVFISWSGERSRAVASALHTLLPDMLQDVHTWMSEHDINAGARWSETLNAELEQSNFGILCLTPENLQSPWLLFEAGSISKSVTESRVVPYLLDLKSTDVTYPLAQFQGVDASKEGTLKLIRAMNAVRSEQMPEARLVRVFERWWPDLEEKLQTLPTQDVTRAQQRPERAILEEILQLVRSEKAPVARLQDPGTPESMVWKTVHDVSKNEIQSMSLEQLRKYQVAVRNRWLETSSMGEEHVLERKLDFIAAELKTREALPDQHTSGAHAERLPGPPPVP